MELIPNTGEKAKEVKAHYSSAVVYNDFIFVSGILPFDGQGREIIKDSFENQCRTVLENLKAVLERSGSDLSHVLKTTLYVSDIELWPRINAIYAEFFGNHKPARSIVPLFGKLHYNTDIEIEAIAIKMKK